MLARNPLSLLSIIAWLRTKAPNERYPFCNTEGECLFSQYLAALGYPRDSIMDAETFDVWRESHVQFGYVAHTTPWTFGEALARAVALERGLSYGPLHSATVTVC
jgi:hypothetical protein